MNFWLAGDGCSMICQNSGLHEMFDRSPRFLFPSRVSSLCFRVERFLCVSYLHR